MKHKILAIGAVAIASAVMSQQPVQAQSEIIGLLRYPKGNAGITQPYPHLACGRKTQRPVHNQRHGINRDIHTGRSAKTEIYESNQML